MKRYQTVLGALAILLVIWVALKDSFSIEGWLALPVVAVGLFGLYSLFTIMKSVLSLKDYPAS